MFNCKKKLLMSVIFASMMTVAYATTDHTMHHPDPQTSTATLVATAKAPNPLLENKSNAVTVFLSDPKTHKGVGEDALKRVHTEKMHALIIDPTLTDYHHVHPRAGKKPGEYLFEFTPATANNYRVWLDVTPVNGEQQYVITDLAGKQTHNPAVIKKLSLESDVEGYHFALSFDKQLLKVGQAVMGSVIITDKNGKKLTQLEPIMEAFAHIVAFNQDYRHILHVHPMGNAPKNASDRGGPQIDFHMSPQEAGFVKIFVQVKINGKELFAPFGVNVE